MRADEKGALVKAGGEAGQKMPEVLESDRASGGERREGGEWNGREEREYFKEAGEGPTMDTAEAWSQLGTTGVHANREG